MKLSRRTLLLVALMLWQGGFMFYGGLVVPVGSQVLGSHRAMSQITQPVTNYLNALGVAALLVWVWELISGPLPRRELSAGIWLACALALAGQFLLHARMDVMMGAMEGQPAPGFGGLHQLYLLISTGQWLLAIVLLVLTLQKWLAEDRAAA